MDKETEDFLEKEAKRPIFTRGWSAEPKEGYIIDGILGGYCESDEMLRKRIKGLNTNENT